jgi:photosystem II stability/assembly factor-like uncharacterized protein
VLLDPHQTLLGSDVLENQHEWVVGISTLYRTDDGGTHWQSPGVPARPTPEAAEHAATSSAGGPSTVDEDRLTSDE